MTATEKAATFMLEANQFFTAVELAKAMKVNKRCAFSWFQIIKTTPDKYEISITGKPAKLKVLAVNNVSTSSRLRSDAEYRELSAQKVGTEFLYRGLRA